MVLARLTIILGLLTSLGLVGCGIAPNSLWSVDERPEPSQAMFAGRLFMPVSKLFRDESNPVVLPSEPEPIYPEVDIPNEPEINKFVREYNLDRRTCLATYNERRQQYGLPVERIFRNYGLPEELIHIAMIESAFYPHARSNRGAVGIFQFIASTARRYGLRVDRKVDDRRDIEKASEAAARHLVDLYSEYQDWPLVLAAYNSGSGTVNRAIASGGTRDFFSLARRGLFPRETRDYVARFMAVALIHRDATPFFNVAEAPIQLAQAATSTRR